VVAYQYQDRPQNGTESDHYDSTQSGPKFQIVQSRITMHAQGIDVQFNIQPQLDRRYQWHVT
jgi:hypothetical protein